MEDYIKTFGYLGIIVWTFLGAEEGVIVSGFLAGSGELSLPGIILASAVGGSLGDQVYFYLALKYGKGLLNRSARIRNAYPRVEQRVRDHGTAVVLASRFMTGLRITIPIVCGSFKMPAAKYSLLNLTSALIWATLYGTVSFYFGKTILEHLKSGKLALLIMALVIVAVYFSVRLLKRRRSKSVVEPAPLTTEQPTE